MKRLISNIGPTLLCIPDISGFTRFMRNVDFSQSSEIITSLLNKIIYTNTIGLKVSEIEGDAVLFYMQGTLPSLERLIDQCQTFYSEFYKEMYRISKTYTPEDKAHKTPEMLGLKVIIHYSKQIGIAQIGKHVKLLGEDVIIAHRLLKNNIDGSEYLLFSESTISYYNNTSNENNFEQDSVKTDSILSTDLGKLKFCYMDLPSNPA